MTPGHANHGELRCGLESIRRRDLPSALALEQWLSRLTGTFGDRVLPIDTAIAERWGRLHVPDPIPTVEGLLAATALVHDPGVRSLDPTFATP